MQADVVILGGGAAGLFCAAEAARRGRRVLVIEHRDTPGEKIRISGGGRCNFTNLGAEWRHFLGRNPRFAISALSRFGPRDFLARVQAAGIAWHEKAAGQLFCDGSAMQVVAMLTGAARQAGAELWTGTSFTEISTTNQGFAIETSRGVASCASLVVATGGKSIPKIGATGAGYRIAERFGLPVTETRPALVPLTFAEADLAWMRPLAGLSLRAGLKAGAQGFEDGLLFTHRGLSGPAVLQISSYWREGEALAIDWSPGRPVAEHLRAARAVSGRQGLAAALAGLVPERLARHLAGEAAGPLAALGNAAIDRTAAGLHGFPLRPLGTEGYRTAEVTLGGVATEALDARTMQARAVPGLYFIGEVVDITGWLGGYNFQWAWSSAWAAGQAV
jgi:hypothetical protein